MYDSSLHLVFHRSTMVNLEIKINTKCTNEQIDTLYQKSIRIVESYPVDNAEHTISIVV